MSYFKYNFTHFLGGGGGALLFPTFGGIIFLIVGTFTGIINGIYYYLTS